MRIRLGPMLAAVLVSSLAAPVQAQTSEYFKLTNLGTTTSHNIYIGPYQAMELGALPAASGPTVNIYCVDYFHEARLGQTWYAYVTPLSGNLNGTTRGGNASLENYLKAAWLTQQFATAAKGSNNSNWWNLETTIWNLLNPASPDPGAGSPWLTLANANYTSINPADYYVVTPRDFSTDTHSTQEFLLKRVSSVPEPASSALLLTGIVGVGARWLRRRRRV